MKYKNELKNEIIIKEEVFYYENVEYKVLITKDIKPDSYNERFYNIYIKNEYMKEKPLNNLQLQERVNEINQDIFTEEYCELRAIEYYLWFKYSNNEKVKFYNIEVYQDN